MITIDVNIGDDALMKQLKGMINAAANTTPLMMEIAGIMHDAVEEAFASQSDPVTGAKWAPLTPAYAAQRAEKGHAGKILQFSGSLASSISRSYGNNYARVGSNKPYAGIHNFGGKTRAHRITAKKAKALRLAGGVYRKSVMHPGSTIPRRRFFGVGQEYMQEIKNAIVEHILNRRGS